MEYSRRMTQESASSPERHTASGPCVGIVLVHGAGNHPKGGTLMEQGSPLLQWLDRCVSSEAGDGHAPHLGEAFLLDATSNTPARATVQFEANGTLHEWVVAECWWDAAYSEPTFRQVLRWTLVIAPWMLITQFTVPVFDSFQRDLTGLAGSLRFLWFCSVQCCSRSSLSP